MGACAKLLAIVLVLGVAACGDETDSRSTWVNQLEQPVLLSCPFYYNFNATSIDCQGKTQQQMDYDCLQSAKCNDARCASGSGNECQHHAGPWADYCVDNWTVHCTCRCDL